MSTNRVLYAPTRRARSRRRLAYALGVAGLALSVAACGATSPMPPEVSPIHAGVDVSRIDYPVPGGHANPAQNWMDLYLPADHHTGRLPLVILIHGGGWRNWIGAGSFAAFAASIARRGVAVLNMEYRRVGSGGGWSTTFSDAAAAVDDVPAIAHRFPIIDTGRSAIVGHSSGAQLAVWAATRNRARTSGVGYPAIYRPAVAFSISGPLDMRRAAALGDRNVVRVLGGKPQQVPQRYAAVDPIENLDLQTPIVAVVGDRDTTVPGILTRDYVTAANAAGGHARLITFAGQTHSSIVSPSSSTFPRLVDEIVGALTPSQPRRDDR